MPESSPSRNSITPSIDRGIFPIDGHPALVSRNRTVVEAEAMEVLLHGTGQMLENIADAGK